MAKVIKLDHIAKIEGHARLIVKIDKGKILKARVESVEGARFFESIIKNRKYDEVSVLTSRICGVCSPIHAITSLMTVENAFGVEVTDQTKNLRELLIQAANIQSHVMHLYFLALPDYIGFPSAIAMAGKHPEKLKLALRLKKLATDLVAAVGGREVHPFTSIVGGFSKLPDAGKLKEILGRLKDARIDVIETAILFQELKYPEFGRETQYFSLESENYDFLKGHITCVGNQCVPPKDYSSHFKEYFQPGSTAKFVVSEGRGYMVGALARLNNNFKQLSQNAKNSVSIKVPNYSPFMINVAQAIELVHSVDRCIELIEALELKKEPLAEVTPKEGRGVAVTEAPRGLLFHDYSFNKEGFVTKANIITPTAQNLRNIEDDIKQFLPSILHMKKNEIVQQLEKLIRSYDPCISCSTHFLDVVWE